MVRHKIKSSSPWLLALIISVTQFSCGSNEGPTLTVNLFAGSGLSVDADPFNDPQVADVVFSLTSVAPTTDIMDSAGDVAIPAGTILDDDNDGNPDTIARPKTCDLGFAVGCGLPPNTAVFTLEDIPLDYQYTFSMRFRTTAGAIVYSGSTTFDNLNADGQTIDLTLNAIP